MAKTRKDPAADLDFDPAPSPSGAGTVEQPSVPSPSSADMDPVALLARALNVSPESIGDLGKLQEQGRLFALADDVKQRAQKIRSEEEAAAVRERCGRSARERTQEVVDANWRKDGVPLWHAWHQHNPAVRGRPEEFPLVVPANSPEEAEARYRRACGIRSTDHFIRAVPLEEVERRRREREAARAAAEGLPGDHPAAF